MDFTISDPQTGDGETTVYAAVGGLPWPTPIRPQTSYFWYLDGDEDPAIPGSGDGTGARPSDFGFPGAAASDLGVDVIVMLDLFSQCDPSTLVCSDFAILTVFAFDGTLGRYARTLGPVEANDAISAIAVGLLQENIDPEREDPSVGMLLAPSFPTRILLDAIPGYFPGDPVALQVVAAIPCEMTLPDGTDVDCQCTDCAACPEYPGCEVAGGTPDAFKVCSDGETACVTDTDCAAGDVCAGEKTCSSSGAACESNLDCTADDADYCGGQSLLPAESVDAELSFAAPTLPTASVDPPVSAPGLEVTIIVVGFPTDTGRAIQVLLGDEVIFTEPAPVFDPVTGSVELTVTLPPDTLYGDAVLTAVLEGTALVAESVVTLTTRAIPPRAEAIVGPIDPLEVGSPVEVSADFTDTLGDTHTAEWDWGDGTTSAGAVAEPFGPTPGVVSGAHDYDTAGVYEVTLTLTDGDGNASVVRFQFVVVFDPNGGFVTGGGFIQSPPGSYAPDPALVGKAHFGFVAKYLPGATIPTGNTEFKVGDLKFKSTGYEWLVVAGSAAQFKGSGTIGGEGNYGFLLTLIDEKLTSSTNVDAFRIKIWDKDDNDTIIYDNRMGEDDATDVTTELSGGSIVLHSN
jgi:PKD repeat protein